LIAVLVLSIQQRPLVLRQASLQLVHFSPVTKQLRLSRLEVALRAVKFLRNAETRPSLRIKLRSKLLHLKLQFMNKIFTISARTLPISNILPRTHKVVLKAIHIAFQPINL
jgi:hypothetical protein